jgi:hypothetical protein
MTLAAAHEASMKEESDSCLKMLTVPRQSEKPENLPILV